MTVNSVQVQQAQENFLVAFWYPQRDGLSRGLPKAWLQSLP